MKWKQKQIIGLALWGVIFFSMLGCIGQQYADPQNTVTLPPQTVTQTTTMPGTVIEIIIPPETITITPAPITSPGQTITVDPITVKSDPITVTETLPPETKFRTITIEPQTIQVPVTTTEIKKITVTTDQVITTEITIHGEPVMITTTRKITLTTTKLICPSGYVVPRGYNECVPWEDAKMMSIGSGGIGGFSWLELVVIVGMISLVLIGLRRQKKK